MRSGDPAVPSSFEMLKADVKQLSEKMSGVTTPVRASGGSGTQPASQEPRTNCRPVFGPGELLELGEQYIFSEDHVLPMATLLAEHEFPSLMFMLATIL